MTGVRSRMARSAQPRRHPGRRPTVSSRAGSEQHGLIDEIEAIARIGSYVLDVPRGDWVSSPGLDAILGIGATYPRTLDGWASLLHPGDREAMVDYFSLEVLAAGRPFDRQYRILRADSGEERWVHGRGRLERDEDGQVVRMLGTIADVTEDRRTRQALETSEQRYAAIFDGTAEAIFIVSIADRRVRWANRAAGELFGYSQAALRQRTIDDLHPPGLLGWLREQYAAVDAGRPAGAATIPCVRGDGSTILADIRASRVLIDGIPMSVTFYADVTALRRLEVQDRTLAQAIEQSSEAVLYTGAAGQIAYVNAAFERLTGQPRAALIGELPNAVLLSPQDRSAFAEMWRAVRLGASWSGTLIHRRPDGTERVTDATITSIRDPDGSSAGYLAIQRDVTAERSLARERERLATALRHTSDAIVISDRDGLVQYVNPAFERISGFSAGDVVGRPQVGLAGASPTQGASQAAARRLTRGEPWSGIVGNRRQDGTEYEAEVVVSPIQDADGGISGYVSVARDVTALRAAESSLARQFRERTEVTAALARLRPQPTAEATATEVCDELLGLPGIDAAMIVHFADRRRAVPLAVGGIAGLPMRAGVPLPPSRAAYLLERAALGPWGEAWRQRPVDGSYGETMTRLGIRAVAYAPIRTDRGLLGVVAAATRDEGYARHLIDQLPAVGEFAATAGALLRSHLERDRRSGRIRERVRRALASDGLRPVFQPIVGLHDGRVVGYEALTRFSSGRAPDLMVADAHAVGLGTELELACLARAIEAAAALDPDCWLSLNVSPGVLVGTSALAGLLSGVSRTVVIEITEHVEIDNYRTVRRAIERLGPRVHLAVDDAGSGFASLRHVVELVPRYLKLDISLVRGVDRDFARQAMIAGLHQFADRSTCQVIAEGIEEPGELAMLQRLGVPLGQGFLLGLPTQLES